LSYPAVRCLNPRYVSGGWQGVRMPESHATGSARLWSRPGGVVTFGELAAAGVGAVQVRSLVRRGLLLPVGRGLYARSDMARRLLGRPEGRRLLRVIAAIAAVGHGAVASHQDAAIIHGLSLLDRPSGDLVIVTQPCGSGRGRTDRPGIFVRSARLPGDQVTAVEGIPVTSVARTVVDLARSCPFRSGVAVADSALHAEKTSKAELGRVLAACKRWPGVERAREVVAFSDGRSESPFESISRVAFRVGGLPRPELQVTIGGEDGPIGRADFLWRRYRTIAEADGALKYADPERARQQLKRDADLRAAGFEVVHFSWQEMTTTPDQVVGAIRAAFRRADVLRAAERSSA